MSNVVIRPAVADDAETLLVLIKELAAYEREEHAVKATAEDLRRDGFGERPTFEALIAEVEGQVAGFALMFPNYSTWEGRAGLYLEDLYVRDWARRHGVGRCLLGAVAALAVARGCARVDLNVLDWNPARGFYQKMGLGHLKSWLPYRLHGPGLMRLAAEGNARDDNVYVLQD